MIFFEPKNCLEKNASKNPVRSFPIFLNVYQSFVLGRSTFVSLGQNFMHEIWLIKKCRVPSLTEYLRSVNKRLWNSLVFWQTEHNDLKFSWNYLQTEHTEVSVEEGKVCIFSKKKLGASKTKKAVDGYKSTTSSSVNFWGSQNHPL